MEELFIGWLREYGYVILFLWSIVEGEMGLIMGGIMSHTGHMQYFMTVFVAGLGGFTGDQIYFYVGRFNKGFIQRKLHKQRRKFAIAHLLLKKYGWPIIFMQRYMYGLRTVIPMSIGITKYSAKKFALINLISAWAWAAITVTPALGRVRRVPHDGVDERLVHLGQLRLIRHVLGQVFDAAHRSGGVSLLGELRQGPAVNHHRFLDLPLRKQQVALRHLDLAGEVRPRVEQRESARQDGRLALVIFHASQESLHAHLGEVREVVQSGL